MAERQTLANLIDDYGLDAEIDILDRDAGSPGMDYIQVEVKRREEEASLVGTLTDHGEPIIAHDVNAGVVMTAGMDIGHGDVVYAVDPEPPAVDVDQARTIQLLQEQIDVALREAAQSASDAGQAAKESAQASARAADAAAKAAAAAERLEVVKGKIGQMAATVGVR